MGKEISRFFKYNVSKLSTPTLKKPVLSSSTDHQSSSIYSTQTSISSQLDNKYITKNQSKNNTSNTYDIHSCASPQKKYSVHSTSTTTRLTTLNTTLPIAPVELHKTKQLPPPGK